MLIQTQGKSLLDESFAPLNVIEVMSRSKSALVVLNATVNNSGEYECQALSTGGNTASAKISITVLH